MSYSVLDGIDGYDVEPMAIFFEKMTSWQRKFAEQVVRLACKYFPEADHYYSGGVDKKYIDLRIGVRSRERSRGRPYFWLWFDNGDLRFRANENRIPDSCLGNLERGFCAAEVVELEDLEGWFDSLAMGMGKKQISISGSSLRPANYGTSEMESEEEMPEVNGADESKESAISLNLILFGPPGTGKTFSTINETLEILEPGLLEDPTLSREDLVEAFEGYVAKGQVVFCTFHQSYSYEDFVEGLRASSQEGQLHYEVKAGLFKRLCERASQGRTEAQDPFDQALACLRERAAANDGRLQLHTVKGKSFTVEYSGGDTFLVYPASTEKGGYTGNLKLVRQLYQTDSKDGIYNVSYVEGMLLYLQGECGLPPFQPPFAATNELEKFVLIIDEINRGNVSRIFGELITLIEETKRAGKPEALSVVLPYSKDRFSVPSNLYLIGTMNTADRSLAGLDIALRRRFTFKEMPPKPELLDDVLLEDVSIGQLLRVMNQRIEVLLGRDYCLGHAYFMDMESDASKRTLAQLALIFRQKILPLLQEYFFEDWERIGWVLNDQHAASNGCQPFIRQPASEQSLVALFGSKVAEGLSDRRWELNDSAFDSIDSYRNILGNVG